MTGVFGEGRSFDAVIPERIGDSTIRVDGVELAHAVAGITVHGFNDRRGVDVHLHMDITDSLRIGAHTADVVVAPHSAELLLAAGWVPPEQAALIGPIVECARGWRRGDGSAFTQELVEAVDRYEEGLDTRA